MFHKKEKPTKKQDNSPSRSFLRKNGLTIILSLLIVIIMVNPGAKAWVLRQLLFTGLFDASIEKSGDTPVQTMPADFYFTDSLNRKWHTSQLRGKVVLINFWASWCPPCRAELPTVALLQSKLKNHPGIFLLFINEDKDRATAKKYLEKQAFSIPFFQRSGAVPPSIYSGVLPTTVVLDKKGKVRFHHEGLADYGSDEFIRQLKQLATE